MNLLSRDLLDPAKLGGAVVYGLVSIGIAIVVGLLVRRSARRLIARTDDQLQRGRIEFMAQIVRVGAYLVIGIAYAHLIPSLRSAGTALLASAGVMGIVLGLAAQNTLGNLIAGISIALYRPFDIGDRLVVPGPDGVENGFVERLTLGNTVLRTEDNRRLVVPNSVMVGQAIINLTSEDPRVQAIVTIDVPYSADISVVRKILLDAADAHPGIAEVEGCPVVALGPSTVTLSLRAWSPDAATAVSAECDLYETALEAFDQHGLPRPYPTMNVNLSDSHPGASDPP